MRGEISKTREKLHDRLKLQKSVELSGGEDSLYDKYFLDNQEAERSDKRYVDIELARLARRVMTPASSLPYIKIYIFLFSHYGQPHWFIITPFGYPMTNFFLYGMYNRCNLSSHYNIVTYVYFILQRAEEDVIRRNRMIALEIKTERERYKYLLMEEKNKAITAARQSRNIINTAHMEFNRRRDMSKVQHLMSYLCLFIISLI